MFFRPEQAEPEESSQQLKLKRLHAVDGHAFVNDADPVSEAEIRSVLYSNAGRRFPSQMGGGGGEAKPTKRDHAVRRTSPVSLLHQARSLRLPVKEAPALARTTANRVPDKLDYNLLSQSAKEMHQQDSLAAISLRDSQEENQVANVDIRIKLQKLLSAELESQKPPEAPVDEELSRHELKLQDQLSSQARQMKKARLHSEKLRNQMGDRLGHVRAFIPIDFMFRKLSAKWYKSNVQIAWRFWLEFCDLHQQEVLRLAAFAPYALPIQAQYRRHLCRQAGRLWRSQQIALEFSAAATLQAHVRRQAAQTNARYQRSRHYRILADRHCTRLQSSWRGHRGRKRVRNILRSHLRRALRQLTAGGDHSGTTLLKSSLRRLDRIESDALTSDADRATLGEAIQLLEAADDIHLEHTIPQKQLRIHIDKMNALITQRLAVREQRRVEWLNAQNQKVHSTETHLHHLASTRWQLDQEINSQQTEMERMLREDEEMHELLRLLQRRDADVAWRLRKQEAQMELIETRRMEYEERETREYERTMYLRRTKEERNQQEFSWVQFLKEQKVLRGLQAIEDHEDQIFEEEMQASWRRGMRADQRARDTDWIDRVEERHRKRRLKATWMRNANITDLMFKKQMRLDLKRIRNQAWRKEAERERARQERARIKQREKREEERIEELRNRWRREELVRKAEIRRKQLEIDRIRRVREEQEIELRERWQMEAEDQLMQNVLQAEQDAAISLAHDLETKRYKQELRSEAAELAWMVAAEAYERNRLGLIAAHLESLEQKRLMEERLEEERRKKEEEEREKAARVSMSHEESQQRYIAGVILRNERAREAKERKWMNEDAMQTKGVWDMYERMHHTVEGRLHDAELRREWIERSRFNKEEKWQRDCEQAIRDAADRKNEILETEMMSIEDLATQKERVVEWEGIRLGQFIWDPEMRSLLAALRNADYMDICKHNVQEVAKFLEVPVTLPMPVRTVTAPPTAAMSAIKEKWNADLQRWHISFEYDSDDDEATGDDDEAAGLEEGPPGAPGPASPPPSPRQTGEVVDHLDFNADTSSDRFQQWWDLAQHCFTLWHATLEAPYLDQAHQAAQEAMKSMPFVSDPHRLMSTANIYEEAGAYQSVLGLLARIIDKFPLFPDLSAVIFRASVILLRLKQYDQSRVYFAHLIAPDVHLSSHSHVEMMFMLARIYECEGNQELADLGFEQVFGLLRQQARQGESVWQGISLNHETWQEWCAERAPWEAMATRCYEQREFSLAADFLEQTLERLPAGAHRDDLWLRLAHAHHRSHNILAARDAFSQVVRIQPYPDMARCQMETRPLHHWHAHLDAVRLPAARARQLSHVAAGDLDDRKDRHGGTNLDAADWQQIADRDVVYYWHSATNVTQYSKPFDFLTDAEKEALRIAEQARQRALELAEAAQADPNWELIADPGTGTEYFYNPATQAIQYERPSGYHAPGERATAAADWQKLVDDSSGTEVHYWWNSTTNETQYHTPGTDPELPATSEGDEGGEGDQ